MKTDRELVEDLSSALSALHKRYSIFLHDQRIMILTGEFFEEPDSAWIDTPGVIAIVGGSGYIYED